MLGLPDVGHEFLSGRCILSMRLIIVQARRALVGSLSEVVFVCLSVTGLRLKYTSLRIVYVSCSTCLLFFMPALMMEDSSEDRQWRQARGMNADIQSAQQRDKRRQYECERRRLARQHQCDSLRSLTQRERDRRRTARRFAIICHVNLQLSTCSAWGTSCACVYLVEC